MITEVIMPKAGMDMQEGEIVKWMKKEGEYVERGEILLEIITDKVNMEVEAETSGYLLKILGEPGKKIPVITTIAYIGDKDAEIPEMEEKIEVKEEAKEEKPMKKAAQTQEDKSIYDIVVIGGGPAGYVSAIRAAQLGGKVAIVEKGAMGGTCLNLGCVPTKTYLKNAEIIDEINRAERRGIMIKDSSVEMDLEKLVAYKDEVVMTLTNGVVGLLKSQGVDIFKGIGRLTKDKKVIIDNKETIKGKNIILAGGSKVAKINIPGIESPLVLSSDEIFELKEIPEKLVVIGGGIIGVEMALAFKLFGSEVTIIELMDRIVPTLDNEVSSTLYEELTNKGINIMTSTKLQEIVEENGQLVLKIDGKEDIIGDKALLSIGRVPDVEALGDIAFDLDKGRIKVNEYMETSVKNIYAVGDINGLKMLAHAASKMGEVAAANAMGSRTKINLNNVPAAIYTIPEAASIGLTEEEAKSKYDVLVGRFNFYGNGRALASGTTKGFVKVLADKRYGEILGAHIVGPGAAEMINEVAALMEMEVTIYEVGQIIHGHPTYSEALVEACEDALDRAIHLPKK